MPTAPESAEVGDARRRTADEMCWPLPIRWRLRRQHPASPAGLSESADLSPHQCIVSRAQASNFQRVAALLRFIGRDEGCWASNLHQVEWNHGICKREEDC